MGLHCEVPRAEFFDKLRAGFEVVPFQINRNVFDAGRDFVLVLGED
jgi:hypothetical protein